MTLDSGPLGPTGDDSGTIGVFFGRLAVLFGPRAAQDEARRYLEHLVRSIDGRTTETTSRRQGPRMSARARRDSVEQASWLPSAIIGPLQTLLADRLGASDAAFVLTERVFPRAAGQITGVASQYSGAHGGLVSAQVGLFLAYVSGRGRALVDGRLYLPAGCSMNDSDGQLQSGQSKIALALEMIDGALTSLPARWVIAGPTLGSDDRFRAEVRQRGYDCLVEVHPTTEVFCHEAPRPARSARSRAGRRGSSPADGALLKRVGELGLLPGESSVVGLGTSKGRAVWESIGGAAGALFWLHTIPGASDSSHRYFLCTTDELSSGDVAHVMTTSLDSPRAELSAPPGESVLDDYSAVTAGGWQKHMTLALIAAAWRDTANQGAIALALSPSVRDLAHDEPSSLALPSANAAHAIARPLGRIGLRGPRADLPASRLLALIAAGGGLLLLGVLVWLATIAQSLPYPGMRELIRVSMFYHPPDDGTPVRALVSRVSHVIFTRGDERYFHQMREAGFSGPAFQYLVANEASGPERLRTSSDRCGAYLQTGNDVTGIARDFCEVLHGDERNFLHNGRGERLFVTASYKEDGATRTRYYYLMNPAATGWREYFARSARENVSALPYGGLFLDNIDLSLRRGKADETNSDGVVAEYRNDAAYREAAVDYLSYLRNQLGATPIWANFTEGDDSADDYAPYLPYVDGVMHEDFIVRFRGQTVGRNGWQAQLQQAEYVINQEKSFLAVGQGPRTDTNRMRFALTSYLMIAGPRTYFRYADGEAYEQPWYYDDYVNRLGSPLGGRYQRGDQWRRDFACGHVTVDVERRAGEIVINSSDPRCVVERVLVRLPWFHSY